eukprot:TRINITY_DN39845_c0_g2_i1.p1 TRINITY_DN39845_c0_g2~~TRINITY_DN39845_c0_g2_i1.p1  ORF type:complete len:214 (+),score=3.92 TRINITY_DN39845_c0_g2_i1:85-642(+)
MYMEGARWLQEHLIVPVLIFPLASAAWIRSLRFLEKATMRIRYRRLRNNLCAAVGTFVFAVTIYAMMLPGWFLMTSETSFGVADVLLLARVILLAFLTTNIILSPRDSGMSGTGFVATVSKGGHVPCQRLGVPSQARQMQSNIVDTRGAHEQDSPAVRTSYSTPTELGYPCSSKDLECQSLKLTI